MVTQGLRKQESSSIHLPPGETQCSFSFLLPQIQNDLSEIWYALCAPTRVGNSAPQSQADLNWEEGQFSAYKGMFFSPPPPPIPAIKPIQRYKRSFPKQVVPRWYVFQPILKQGQEAFPRTQGPTPAPRSSLSASL